MKRIIQLASLVSVLALFAGCGGSTTDTSSTPAPEETATDHAAEANRTITDENMDRHLEDLEAEIAADEEEM